MPPRLSGAALPPALVHFSTQLEPLNSDMQVLPCSRLETNSVFYSGDFKEIQSLSSGAQLQVETVPWYLLKMTKLSLK